MGIRDRKNGVPNTAASIPLVDPNAMPPNPSIGDLVKDATAQVSTLVRAEVELARAEITRDVKKGLTGSVFFIAAAVVLLYSTFFLFLFLAELLDTWLWRWAAFLIVFILMLAVTGLFALLGFLKVRRIRGPKQTIASVKETTAALTPSLAKFTGTPSQTTTAALEYSPAPSIPTAATTRPAATTTAAVVEYQTAEDYPAYVEYTEPPTEYSEYVEYTEYEEQPTTYVEYTSYEEQPTGYSDYVEYEEQPTTYVEYTSYEEQPTTYVEYTSYEEQPNGYSDYVEYTGDHDPTAAVYADTGRPVTSDRLPGDTSGW